MRPYYAEDGITIYHGDCRDVLPTITQDVAAVVTDPPYGTEALGGGYGRRQLVSADGRNGHTIANDADLSVVSVVMGLAFELLPPGGWLCSFASPRRRHEMECVLLNAGLTIAGEIIWDKGVPGLGYTIRYSHESIVVSHKGEATKPERAALSVYRINQEVRAMRGRHPHEKPVELLGRLVELTTVAGETVIDPFMGSGTTLRAAKDLHRRGIGIEIDERYCEMAARRLSQHVLSFGGVGGAQ